MHELAIAENLLQIVNETIKEHHLIKVERIKLKIGILTAVVPEALEFSWRALTEDTMLEHTRLDMEIVTVRGRCKGCGKEVSYKTNDAFCFLCPECGGEIEILTGRELNIEEIEGEGDEDSSC